MVRRKCNDTKKQSISWLEHKLYTNLAAICSNRSCAAVIIVLLVKVLVVVVPVDVDEDEELYKLVVEKVMNQSSAEETRPVSSASLTTVSGSS